MKKIISVFLSLTTLWLVTFQTSCIGPFKLTNNFWEWNRGLDKWVGGVFFLFIGSWVTGITVALDAVIFNTLEFWFGTNPISMNEGDMEHQLIVGNDGNTYKVTATKNRFDLVQVAGDQVGLTEALIYDPSDRSWTLEKNCKSNKVIQLSENQEFVTYFAQDGRRATLPVLIQDKDVASNMLKEQFESQVCTNE